MAEKLKIRANVAAWDSWEMDGKLPDIISKLQKVISDNPTLFEFDMSVDTESGYYGSSSTNITITAYRWETDEEMVARLANDKRLKEEKRLKAIRDAEANEKREKSLYESLKKKFEKELNEKL